MAVVLFGLAAWLASPAAHAACVEAPAGMSAWWPLDTDAGTGTLADWIGGPPATPVSGTLVLGSGMVGGALQLNGIDQGLSVPAASGSDLPLSGMTIMAWVRLTSTALGPIVAREPRYRLSVSTDGMWFAFCDDQVCYSSGLVAIPVPEFQWVHVAMTWGLNIDQGTVARFYVNGSLAQTMTWSGIGNDIAAPDPLTIGYSALTQEHLAGSLDELMLFKRALSPAEVQAIWAAQSDGVCAHDCNMNGVLDAADIAAGTSADCNGNGIPDVCDVNPADPDGDGIVLADCNGNGIPDSCELDCNSNGIPDACDIDPSDPDGDGIVYADCNANGAPDNCEGITGPIYVDDDPVSPSGAIGSATNPFRHISDAVSAASAGCEIRIRPGDYYEPYVFIGFGTKSIHLIGEGGPDVTIVHGGGAPTFIVDLSPPIIEGLTIEGGHSVPDFSDIGGCVADVNGNPTFRNCVLRGGVGVNGGGGVGVHYGNLTMEDCRIESCSAPVGGGVFADALTSNIVLRRCTFTGNTGGALYAYGTTNTIEDCTFEKNTNAAGTGGAYLSLSSADTRIRRSRFVQNTGTGIGGMYMDGDGVVSDCVFALNSGGNGGGLDCEGNATVANCSVADNTSTTGSGLHVLGLGYVWNCIAWGNTPNNLSGVTGFRIHSCIVEGGSNSVDPLFANEATGDLRLRPNSPAIDAGANLYTVSTTDLLGNPREADDLLVADTGEGTAPIVDIGAYEGAAGVSGGIAGLLPGGNAMLSPDGAGADPRDDLTIDITNESTQSGDVWFSALGDLHGDEGDVVVFPAQAIVETSLPDGDHWTRVSLPFTADDLGAASPAQVDLLTFDQSTQSWELATAGNTAPSPGHAGPVGDRFIDIGWPAPALSADLGDYGVVWDPETLKGFAWANVDHTTDFATGHDQTSVDVPRPEDGPGAPAVTRLIAPAPNPTLGATTISFDLARDLEVDLSIYDVAGRRVRTLARGRMNAGEYRFTWNRDNERGAGVHTGIYFVRFVTPDYSGTQRIVVLE